MGPEIRRRIAEPEALEALAHPLRLELITHLMAAGPATASACARAVRDSPSNCSYHLRVLAQVGLVGEVVSGDGRERPWQALITGFDTGSEDSEEAMSPEESKLLAVSVQRDQRVLRQYLSRRDGELNRKLDAAIRPYIAATRVPAPDASDLVHVDVHAFRLTPE